MRILQVNDFPIDDDGGGGAEVLLARTIRLLRAGGAEVGLFTAADLPDRRRTAFRYLSNPVACQALAERLRSFRPDVVHLHNFYHVLSPAILAELEHYRAGQRVRIVMTAHDYHLVCPNSGGTWFLPGPDGWQPIDPARIGSLAYLLSRRWDQRGWRYSLMKTLQHLWHYRCRDAGHVIDLVICPSRFIESLVRQTGRPTRWLPHPAPTGAAGQRRVEEPNPLRLVFAGRLQPEKGLDPFLRAMPADWDGTLTVIGDGPERQRCEETCRQRGLSARVRFLGRRTHAETLAELARAHVLVLPSLFMESYGLVLIEALAAGTNVLASDRGACRELIEDAGAGYLFPPGDANNLALQLDRIHRAHQTGTLNRFDVSHLLAARSDAAYVEALWQIYRGDAAERAEVA